MSLSAAANQGAPTLTASSGSGVAGGSGASGVSAAEQTEVDRPRTWLQSGIVKPKHFHDDMVRYGFYSATGEPETT